MINLFKKSSSMVLVVTFAFYNVSMVNAAVRETAAARESDSNEKSLRDHVNWWLVNHLSMFSSVLGGIDKKDRLLVALRRRHADDVRSLLQDGWFTTGCDVDARHDRFGGCTALHFAASSNYIDGIEILCSQGADANIRGLQDGCTALELAVLNRHTEAVRALCANGADASTPNTLSGIRPLDCAVVCYTAQMINILCSHGAEANAVNPFYGFTPIFFVAQCEQNHEEIVAELCREGADVNHRSTMRNITPLELAILKDNRGAVEALCNNGADMYALNSDLSCTPLMLACALDREEIEQTLREKGADNRELDHAVREVLVNELKDQVVAHCLDLLTVLNQFLNQFNHLELN